MKQLCAGLPCSISRTVPCERMQGCQFHAPYSLTKAFCALPEAGIADTQTELQFKAFVLVQHRSVPTKTTSMAPNVQSTMHMQRHSNQLMVPPQPALRQVLHAVYAWKAPAASSITWAQNPSTDLHDFRAGPANVSLNALSSEWATHG
jgi:hypothetical protein